MRPVLTAHRTTLLLLLTVVALPCHATLCTLSASAMAFGNYDTILVSPNDTTGIVQVSCTPAAAEPLTTAYTLTIAGTGASGDSIRSLSFDAYRLYYQVYSDAARSIVWGNGSGSGAGVASSVTSTASLVPALRNHTAYARMPGLQKVRPGAYMGSLMVTIDY